MASKGVKTSANGCYRFDRDFTRIGVGRIQISSGTKKLTEYRRRDGILTKLSESANVELLKALQRGDISIEELVDADRKDKLNSLTDLHIRRPLWSAVYDALNGKACGPESRRRYLVSIKALRTKAHKKLGDGALLSDLLSVDWVKLRETWGGSEADWNHMRRALSTALSGILGDKYHPFRREVMAKIPKANEGNGRVPDLSPEDFWRVVAAMPEYTRPAPVVLVATAMRLGEYMKTTTEHLKPSTRAIDVPGTKTEASRATVFVDERLWHWVEAGVPAPLGPLWLRKYWRRACDAVGVGDVRLHDLRHCFGQWAVAQGVAEAAVQVSLRHSTPEMTRRYTRAKDKGEAARAVGEALLHGF